jgi:hypothetical protein
MSFYERLAQQTLDDRAWLTGAPVIQRCLKGDVTRDTYIAFLTQAYHHVRHTVPLMMAVGSRLGARHDWLRQDVMHYLEEENGHEAWILADIAAAGGDASAAAGARPDVATEAMVAYAYDSVMRRNPVGFFGMVFVLEGTSAALALLAADRIQAALKLPARALTYLRSHGQLDQEHTHHLAGILDRLDPAKDHPAVLECARTIFWLYGNMFRRLETPALSIPGEPRRLSA